MTNPFLPTRVLKVEIISFHGTFRFSTVLATS